MAFLGQEEQLREFQDRFKYLNAVLVIGLGLLVARLIYLQILNGDQMRKYSEENRIKRVTIAAPRGMIFDRNRMLLVDNRPSFDLEITPQYLRESKKSKEVTKKVAELLQIPQKSIRKKLRRARHQPAFVPVKIKTELSRDEVAKIETWKLGMPGVAVKMEIKRTNVHRDVASHLLGYIGKVSRRELPRLREKERFYKLGDSIGKSGIEKQMEDTLRGDDGQELVEVDALGRRIRSTGQAPVLGGSKSRVQPAKPGNNLILTVDQDLQMAAVEAFGDRVGGVVAIDPRTGEILAMISRPSFDSTEFSRGISPQIWKSLTSNEYRPLRDKTIQDHYAPGSVFKAVTAIAALEEGTVNRATKFHCPGWMRLGRRVYHCHKRGGHGDVAVVRALSESCDVYFYRVAQKLKSVNVIAKWAKKLGLGKRTEVNLPREVPGLIPTEEWKLARFKKPWTRGESLTVAIGQSFVLTTTLQLANLYATIANGGTLFKPYFISSVESFDGEVLDEFQSTIVNHIDLQPETIRLVKKGLFGVVNGPRGTARSQRLPGMMFAGKTGTSQVVRLSADKIYTKCQNMKYQFRHHGLFAGFAPVDDPVIAVAVIAEHACSGSRGAAPVAKEVIKTYLEKYFPDQYGKKPIAKAPATPVAPLVKREGEEDHG